MQLTAKITNLWRKVSSGRPLQKLYLGSLLALGLLQGIISVIALLFGPDKPVGSR